MEYILFIHNNAKASVEDWSAFFNQARASGLFVGGSEIGNCMLLGADPVAAVSGHIGGFMRFHTDDKSKLLQLLESHPVLANGGTLELCEMPKS